MTTKLIRSAIVAALAMLLALPAFPQFEVNPDHFESPAAPDVAKTNPQQQRIQARIQEQQKILEKCQSQIKAKADEIEATLQDLTANGDEAGQVEALWIHEKELAALKQALAPKIRDAQEQLARLHVQLATPVAKAGVHPASQARKGPKRVHHNAGRPAGLSASSQPGPRH